MNIFLGQPVILIGVNRESKKNKMVRMFINVFKMTSLNFLN